jgi:sarcosine oxidase delta subunit
MSKVIIVQVGWSAESNKSWIAADGGTDDRPGTTLNISENTSEQNRSGKVTYTQVESGNRVVVNVNQEGKEVPAPKYTYTIRTNEPGVEFLVYRGEEGSGDFIEIERVTASTVVGGKYVATFETEEEDGRYRVKPLKSVVNIDITGFNFSGSTNTSFTETVSSSTASFDLRPNDSHRKQAIISTTGWTSTSQVFNASREVEIDSVISNRVWGEDAIRPIYSAECFQAEDEEEPQCGTSPEETHIDGYDVFGAFNIGVPTRCISGKMFTKNGKFTADIEYQNTDVFKYAVSTHLLLDVNVFAGTESSRYYGFKVRRDDPVVYEMLNSGCQPEFSWKNRAGNNRTGEAFMMRDSEYAYWVVCIENEDDFPDSGGVHYQYCVAYLSAGTNSISFENNGGETTIPVSACSIDTEWTIPANDYWSGNEVDTGKTKDETNSLTLEFACDVLSGHNNVTVTETCGDFRWDGGSSSGSVLVEVEKTKPGQAVTDTLRPSIGGRGGVA